MHDDEMLKKLLRLKQYETPGPEYFERFLDEFHARMARESRARHGLRDRMFTWVEELFPSPRLGWSAAAGGMMAVVVFGFMVAQNSPMEIQQGRGGALVAEQTGAELRTGTPVFASVPGGHGSIAMDVNATEARPTPIIYPELIAPVSYTTADGAAGAVNLAAPVSLRQNAPGDSLRLRGATVEQGEMYADTSDIMFLSDMPVDR